MSSGEAVVAFVETLPFALRPSPSAVAAVVDAAWTRARRAHPGCAVSAAALFAYIGARIHEGDAVAELARRHVEDVYVACGCACGDPGAIAALERAVLPRVASSLRMPDDDRREVMQVLRERMLVAPAGEADGAPRIAVYDGRAPLVTWLRVCAVRLGRNHVERVDRAVPLDDVLDQIAPGVADPALAYLKRRYGAAFRVAFGDAVAGLTARERNLLRYSVGDGLGIDQIAAIYHVHRSTLARQLQQARRALALATRAQLQRALGVDDDELESLLRMLMTMTDAALQQMLARGAR